jgi:formylglycine-generating enzyme required for sulfatase activity
LLIFPIQNKEGNMTRKVTVLMLAIMIIVGFDILGCTKEDNFVLNIIVGRVSISEFPGAISGVVTDATNGTVLPGVTVSTTPATSSDTTDVFGQYTMTDLDPDTYAVTAVKSGYNTNTIYVEVIAGSTTTANIELTTFSGSITIEWISVPSGNFVMGSLPTDPHAQVDEQPQHTVYLDDYQISKYEITNAQYLAFMDAGGYSDSTYWTAEGWEWRETFSVNEPYWWSEGDFNSGTAYPHYPVVGVSWHESYAFCQWIGGRLPTEAEWEKAARGTDSTNYWPWGSTWEPSRCNSYYDEPPDTFAHSAPVGYFDDGQSPYAVYDPAGNVWEWINDWYQSDYYSVSPDSNPPGPTTGLFRVFRGGGWGNIGNYLCRTADRRYHNQVGSNGVIGIRPAK